MEISKNCQRCGLPFRQGVDCYDGEMCESEEQFLFRGGKITMRGMTISAVPVAKSNDGTPAQITNKNG